MNIFLHLDMQYLKETLPPDTDSEFFDFLSQLNTKGITLYAIDEGSVVFPRYEIISNYGNE